MTDKEQRVLNHLWDFFVIAQMDMLSVVPDERKVFEDFVAGKSKRVPFVEGSAAYEVCKLCEKL